MKFSQSPRRSWAVAVVLAGALGLTACSSGDGASDGAAASGEPVELSFLVDNTELTLALANGLADAFTAANPDITVAVESRPQGGEGDNLVKTKLATGEMTDVFQYNSGSLFAALSPQKTVVPITDQAYVANLGEAFTPAVTVDGQVYGVPIGSAMGGGVLYNKKIYADLGLTVPTTWAEFMANNEKIKAAGKVPVIQTYQDTWTSQLFVLGDFHNVSAVEPDFATKYTANQTSFSTSPAAIKGWEHLQAVKDAEYLNEDFASATYADGIRMVATGEGAHYPMLTFAIPEVVKNYAENVEDVGFFALPGDDAAKNGLTAWSAAGVYIATTAEGAKLDAAKKFLGFIASVPGCEAQTAAAEPSGPYQVNGCTLPDTVPGAVKDLQAYFVKEGGTSPALEFLSPIKGPALEQITVEVGSGIKTAQEGAALYDQDVEKQAKQLGIPGW